MADLINCPDCGKEMSKEAVACPSCGKPGKAAIRKKRGNMQGGGCLFIIIGFLLMLAVPPLGIIVGIIGLVVLIMGFFA